MAANAWGEHEIADVCHTLGWHPTEVRIATSWWQRLGGLIPRSWSLCRHGAQSVLRVGDDAFVLSRSLDRSTREKAPAAVEIVMCFPRCSSVHTYFMRHAIDVVFLNREGAVLQYEHAVSPGKVCTCRQAWVVIERLCMPGEEQAKHADSPRRFMRTKKGR